MSRHSFNLSLIRYIFPQVLSIHSVLYLLVSEHSLGYRRFYLFSSFLPSISGFTYVYVWLIDLLLEECGGSLLTHVVVRVPEVQPHLHVRLLLLGQGGEPLIAYAVQHYLIHPDRRRVHFPILCLHRFDKQFMSSDFMAPRFHFCQIFLSI